MAEIEGASARTGSPARWHGRSNRAARSPARATGPRAVTVPELAPAGASRNAFNGAPVGFRDDQICRPALVPRPPEKHGCSTVQPVDVREIPRQAPNLPAARLDCNWEVEAARPESIPRSARLSPDLICRRAGCSRWPRCHRLDRSHGRFPPRYLLHSRPLPSMDFPPAIRPANRADSRRCFRHPP